MSRILQGPPVRRPGTRVPGDIDVGGTLSARHSVVVRLAGESGEGVISCGDILTQAAARGGYYTQTFRTFPAE
ncbi:MAG: hypothetical protein ABGX38_04220, partial [Thermoleophilia bacterium]